MVWQPHGYYDHACRDEADVLDLGTYIEYNPIRKGLVTRAEDWLFSSAHPSRKDILDWDW
jgi:putative transposase